MRTLIPGDSTTNGDSREVSAETDELSLMVEAPSIRFQRRESFLFNTRVPIGKYVITMAALSLVPSLLLGIFLGWIGVLNEETGPPLEAGSFSIFVAIVFFAPPVETAAMAFSLWVLSFVTQRLALRAALNSILWGVLHSATAIAWGLVVWWPFFVFSCAFLAWRRKSWWHAFIVATCIHMIQNLIPGILLLLGLE